MSHKYYFLIAAILCAATLHAQAPVRGTVQDPQGKPVDGAALVLYRQGASSPLAQARSVNGEFLFPGTTTGDYLLQVSAEGFRRASLAVNGGKSAMVRLQVAGIDQRVVV